MHKRLNITLPAEVLERADAFAQRERYTRSGLIADALDAFVGARETAAQEAPAGGASNAAEAPAEYGGAVAPAEGLCLERVAELVHAFFSARDDVEAAWVFGSVARGTCGPTSDVDIAILPSPEVPREAWWNLRLTLMSRLPGALGVAEVDVVAVPEMGAVIGQRALVEGVRVHGRFSRRAAEAEIAALRAYDDFKPISRALDARLGERVRAYGSRRS